MARGTVGRWHGRELRGPGVELAGAAGRGLFAAALGAGGAGAFFPLCGAFETQAEPAFCGLGALTTVLNALRVDPGRPWLSPASGQETVWRWFGDTMLDCCKPLDEIRAEGLTLDQVACLARCNGAAVDVERGRSLVDFREAVRAACAESKAAPGDREFMVASYDRGALNQTGTGHFAPVAAFAPAGPHSPEDQVLLFDVAKFKYPPHWVPLSALHNAMKAPDPATGRPRGYLLLRRREELRGQAAPQLSLDYPQAKSALEYARGVRQMLRSLSLNHATEAEAVLFATNTNTLEIPGFRAAAVLKVHAPATGSIFLRKLRNDTHALRLMRENIQPFIHEGGDAGLDSSPGRTAVELQGTDAPLDAPGERAGGEGGLGISCCSTQFLSDCEARAVLTLACPACDDSWRTGTEKVRDRREPTPELAASIRSGAPPPAPWDIRCLRWWDSEHLPEEVAREVDHVAAQLRAFAAAGV